MIMCQSSREHDVPSVKTRTSLLHAYQPVCPLLHAGAPCPEDVNIFLIGTAIPLKIYI